MNGKIDADGNLHIERAGEMKAQRCPRHTGYKERLVTESGSSQTFSTSTPCGDWCALFLEEVHETERHNLTAIRFCNRVQLVFKNFTDERNK